MNINNLLKTELGRLYLAVRLLAESSLLTEFNIGSDELYLQKDKYGLEVSKDNRVSSLASTFTASSSDINKAMRVFVKKLREKDQG